MTHWETLYDKAVDNYGLITTAQATEYGINPAELPRWVKMGRLEKRGHGVYRLSQHNPTDYDYYAEAVMFAGEGAVIYGESVLAMMNLALVNPSKVHVATRSRLRKKLPDWMRIVPRVRVDEPVFYKGIPCQSIANAIITCRKSVPQERLRMAMVDARNQGFITMREETKLKKELAK